MKLTDYIVCFLEELQIDTVFGYIGGSVADLIHSICESKHVQYIQSYHEHASKYTAGILVTFIFKQSLKSSKTCHRE